MNRTIDLAGYAEDELIELNQRIVERLQSLQQKRRLQDMARFNLGDTVSFTPETGQIISGTVIRTNAKTITVLSTNGQQWRVSPSLLAQTLDGTVEKSPVAPHLVGLRGGRAE